MAAPPSFKTVNASVRPARVAILIDKNDEDWQDACLHIIEFFAQIWGGTYNLIVPTDGKTIDERLWTSLEAFDPDNLYVYRNAGVMSQSSHIEIKVERSAVRVAI